MNAAFSFMGQRYNRTPCRECKGRNTVAVIVGGMVSASCEDCGGATRVGALAKLWNPAQREGVRERPILRAPQEPPVNGRPARRWSL